MSYPAINWSVDSLDWYSQDSTAILQIVKSQSQAGLIILFRDVHQATLDVLPQLLVFLKTKNWGLSQLAA